uniref:Ig-like domain-containing protein n=1 Tax=Gopherus evgoodei TaxID=1825980 RepID=A0A8C4YKC7_9SAUR
VQMLVNMSAFFSFEIEPPSFIKKVENVTALVGDTVTLQSVVKGSSPISITWMKGKDIIKEDNKVKVTFENGLATLQITGVQISSGGKYTCVAENDAGSQTCFGELAVKEPAQITEKPELIEVTAGDPAILEYTVAGTPELKTKWFKDGKPAKYKMSFVGSKATLKLIGVAIEDSGEYVCEAKNDSPYFSKEFEPMEVLKDSDVALECEVSGTPPFEVFWLKDNKPVRSSRRHRISIEDSLISLHVFRFDASAVGEYQCRVTNAVGSCVCTEVCSSALHRSALQLTLTKSLFFLPLEPPQFVKKIENISSLRGGSAVFQAALKGSLPITVSWLKDNDDVIEDNNIKMTFVNNMATLLVRSIEVKHDGKYFCQAKNDAGIQRCSALLTVKGWFSTECFRRIKTIAH